jgi:hypothetical protein
MYINHFFSFTLNGLQLTCAVPNYFLISSASELRSLFREGGSKSSS